MPLIDEKNTHLDVDLMSNVAEFFSEKDGLIIDRHGNLWYLWRSDALESWWRLFEEVIDSPMGRKLANSACDEEEFLLENNQLDASGFFRKKKAFSAMKGRWNLHGWGTPHLSPPSFESIGLTPLFAGIMHAGIERIDSSRYRMLWEEKSLETTIFTLEPRNIPLTKSVSVISKNEYAKPLVL